MATGALIVGLAAACSGPSPEPPRPAPDRTALTACHRHCDHVARVDSSVVGLPSAAEPIPSTHTFSVVEHERFDEPWAMVALPGTRVLAVTEQGAPSSCATQTVSGR
ncbi:hypothetical protein G7085_08145 [Tessaracoccus sp. HDW20]|uniref:hypothetical protein n=1 Tax=Tessaracoccus coleopterorum TaxID=2714950 RepID=UPI0018D45160|nr:hypothetical protein [Tessaracoccus coleopterorum]NHB84594.1 hypothetical protein [Tessaracoccus coleopterorum]